MKQFNGKQFFLIFSSYNECSKIEPNDSTVWIDKAKAFYKLK